MRVEYTLAAT